MKKKSETHALCTLCNSAIAYANMGEAALKRHEMLSKTDMSAKHQKRAAEKDQATKALSYLHFMKATPREAIDFYVQTKSSARRRVNVNMFLYSHLLQQINLPRQISNLQRVNLPR